MGGSRDYVDKASRRTSAARRSKGVYVRLSLQSGEEHGKGRVGHEASLCRGVHVDCNRAERLRRSRCFEKEGQRGAKRSCKAPLFFVRHVMGFVVAVCLCVMAQDVAMSEETSLASVLRAQEE